LAQISSDNSPYQPSATTIERAAAEDLELRAEAGSAQAQNELSKQYMGGKIFKRNVPEAVRWVSAAANQGLAEAEVDLAILYLEGTGIPRDYSKGFSWMKKAADQDEPKAAYNLGNLYGLGRGVTQDVAQGVHWFLKAAELGNPAGAYKMGVASEQGASVPLDLVKAYMWYYIASSRYDYYWSKEPLREIGPKIGPKGIEDARKQAELWIEAHPKHQAGPYDAP
jgi:TPR repeat protein